MNSKLNGKKIAVIGLGISNIAVVSYLLKHDLKHLAVFDTRYNPPHLEELPAGLDINLGPLDAKVLKEFDMIVISQVCLCIMMLLKPLSMTLKSLVM